MLWIDVMDSGYEIRWPQYMPLHIVVNGYYVDSSGNMCGYATCVRILCLIISVLYFQMWKVKYLNAEINVFKAQ